MRGSITKQKRKKGTVWWARIDVPAGPYNKREQKSKSFKTKREAERWLAHMNHTIYSGEYTTSSNMRLDEFLDRWLKRYGENNLRETTLADYRKYMTNHILPELGRLQLKQLTPQILQEFYQRKLTHGHKRKSGGLAPSTVRNHLHGPLHRALESAVKWNLLPNNPASHVELPRARKKESDWWNKQQVIQFLETAQKETYPSLYMLLYTALRTGMRRGELLALEWRDIDFARQRLAVRRSATKRADGRIVIGEPKTQAGRRTIALDDELASKLRDHENRINKQRHLIGKEWKHPELVFPSTNGNYIGPSNLRRTFNKLIQKAEVPKITFHDLRHCHATLMLQAGIHPKIVSERLGHSSINVTIDKYSHVLPNMQSEAAEIFAQTMDSSEEKEDKDE